MQIKPGLKQAIKEYKDQGYFYYTDALAEEYNYYYNRADNKYYKKVFDLFNRDKMQELTQDEVKAIINNIKSDIEYYIQKEQEQQKEEKINQIINSNIGKMQVTIHGCKFNEQTIISTIKEAFKKGYTDIKEYWDNINHNYIGSEIDRRYY